MNKGENLQTNSKKSVSNLLLPNVSSTTLLPVDMSLDGNKLKSDYGTTINSYFPSLSNGSYGFYHYMTSQKLYLICCDKQKMIQIINYYAFDKLIQHFANKTSPHFISIITKNKSYLELYFQIYGNIFCNLRKIDHKSKFVNDLVEFITNVKSIHEPNTMMVHDELNKLREILNILYNIIINYDYKLNENNLEDNNGETIMLKQKQTIQQHQEIMQKAKVEVDLQQIFKTQATYCDGTICNCLSLTRLCIGLKYYEISKQNPDVNTTDMFDSFNNSIYTSLLNDYIHVMKQHSSSEQIIDIQNELETKYHIKKCNVQRCINLQRHYRSREKEEKVSEKINKSDSYRELYCDWYDAFHHRIFHLFDLGLRFIPADNKENKEHNDNNDIDNDDISFVDQVFATKRDLLIKQTKQCENTPFTDNNKFTIHINNNENDQETKTSETIFLDGMYEYIEAESTNIDINEVKKYLPQLPNA
eukprot:525239_1